MRTKLCQEHVLMKISSYLFKADKSKLVKGISVSVATQHIEVPINVNNIHLFSQSRFCCQDQFFALESQFQELTVCTGCGWTAPAVGQRHRSQSSGICPHRLGRLGDHRYCLPCRRKRRHISINGIRAGGGYRPFSQSLTVHRIVGILNRHKRYTDLRWFKCRR